MNFNIFSLRHSVLTFITIITCSFHAFGSISGDMNAFFKSMGGYANVSRPSIYKDQMAGHFSGGSLYYRTPVKVVKPLSVTPPSLSSGNCGIDLHLGGFSFINSDQLVQLGKNITSSAVSFASQLALETFAPSVFNIMQDMQNLASEISRHALNSCETGKALVAGVWSKFQTGNSQVCKALGTEKGLLSDWAKAQNECDTGGKSREIMNNSARGSSSLKDQLPPDVNIAWHLLQKGGLTRNQPLAELIMSISGTIITVKGKPIFKSSMATNAEFLKGLLEESGQGKKYKCDEPTKCLNPSIVAFESGGGFLAKIKDILVKMADKMQKDTPLNEEHKAILMLTRLPIWKILNIENTLRRAAASETLGQYAEPIGYDMLYEYLSSSTSLIEALARDQVSIQMDPTTLQSFLKNLNTARTLLFNYKNLALKRAIFNLNIIEQIKNLETQINIINAERLS